MPSRKSWFNSLLLAGLLPLQDAYAQQYLLGVGIGDVTGWVFDLILKTNMMGYADLSQTDTGLHMRQFSRAFIVATPGTNSAKDRILFINSDLQSGDTAIRRGILDQLNQLYPGLYTEANVALVGTHSHAGVGGFLNNLLPTLTSLGFVKQTYDAIVNGTVLAVKRAHESLAPGTLSLGNVTVLDTNLNRSPYAYEANPASERARYQYDQDKELHLLKFTDNSGTARGLLSFFAVHGTSLYQGMAAYLYEADVQPDAAPGKNTFVAGFVQGEPKDIDHVIMTHFLFFSQRRRYHIVKFCVFQPRCILRKPGKAMGRSTVRVSKVHMRECNPRMSRTVRLFGPGFQISDFESNRIIGENQYLGAKKLMASNSLTAVKGAVRSLHTYVNMSNYSFSLSNGTTVHTCPPAMGYSFAGGTSDGPGAFDFTQGETADGTQNPFWEIVKGMTPLVGLLNSAVYSDRTYLCLGIITAPPSQEQKQCHYPKPILLNTVRGFCGYTKFPYAWQPDIVDIQMMRVGQFVVLVVPGEFTTMAGRRIRESVRAKLIESGVIGNDAYVVLAGPANTYSHYVTTREEYGIQRYEGASTIYGPFTLEAYQNLYTGLVSYLADGASSSPPAGPIPEDLTKKAISLQTGVVFDAAPIGKSFGSVLTDVTGSYKRGQKVTATFQAANPRVRRNNLRLEGTFLTIDRLTGSTWSTYRTDSHPSTKFRWTRTNTVLGHSTVEVEWIIESNAPAGTYRVTYYGDSKPLIGSISSFTGRSSNFTVSA
ncbi:ceramidase [Rhizoctonia solani AG-1 IA]|uniref:Neutral ceramidase n=1 Tax=Thanatephorus cucumeris (strain AG1-IA) TaxID=983506 RepID=L8WKA2_THACA|nr:ceramidase [Rhizoctonia solani AG-1 IA]